MTLTLSKLMARVWRETGQASDITATAGSTTTVVDANTKYTADDSLIGGTALVVMDAAGAGAAPEGEYSRISDFVASTFTFSVLPAFSVAVAVGDLVLLARPTVSIAQMIQAVNDGLTDLGYIRNLDTSISLVAGTVQYVLPVTMKTDDLVDVMVQSSSTSMPYSIKDHCRVEPSTPGGAAVLWVEGYIPTATARIIYNGYHPKLTSGTSVVSETIPESLAVAAAIDKVMTWLVSKRGDAALGTFQVQRWNDAKQTLASMKAEHPVYRMPRKTRWASFTNDLMNGDDR